MIVCNKCNHQNPDDATFCASCNAFLAWDGTRVADAAPPPPEPEPAAEPESSDPSRPGLIQRVKAVVLDQGPEAREGAPPRGEGPAAPDGSAPGWSGQAPPGAAPGAASPPGPPPAGPWGGPPAPGPGPAPAPSPGGWRAPASGSAPAPVATPPPAPAPTPAPPPAAPGAPPPAPGWGGQPPTGYGAASAPAPPRPPQPAPAPVPTPAPPPVPPAGGYGAPPAAPAPVPPPSAPPAPAPIPGPPPAPPEPSTNAPAGTGSAPAAAPTPAPGAAGTPPAGPAPGAVNGAALAGAPPAAPAPAPMPAPTPAPTPAPAPAESFDVVPDAEAAARSRQEAENARRYAAERARQEAEEAEREAFRKRQEAAAALFEQPAPTPTPTPLPGQPVPTSDPGRWGPAPAPTPPPAQPAAAAPQAQLPGAAEAKRFAPRPVAQPAPPKPGDLVCGSCGAGNDQARKFCRQCGASLVAAVVEPKVPWWKRIFKRNKKHVPPPRPTGPGRPTKKTQRKRTTRKVFSYIRTALGLIAIAGVLGVALVPKWRASATDFLSCKRRQAEAIVKPPVKHIPLAAARATTEALPDHPASKAFDSNPATFWQAAPPAAPAVPPVPGAPAPPAPPAGPISLTVDFVEPATVRQIHFFPGLPKANNPNSQPTPKTVVMTFRNERGETVGKQERVVLETNVAKEDQLLKLGAKKNVRSVEVTVLDSFASQGGGTQVTISDVQFFGSPAQASDAKCKVG